MPLRVLICSDAPLMRDGLRTMLDAEPDIDVVDATDSGVHAMMLARTERLDVVLTGLSLTGISGVELIRRLDREDLDPAPGVVVLAVGDSDASLREVLHAGAAGLLTKDTNRDELVTALRAVAMGHAMLAPQVTQRLLGWLREGEPPADDLLQPAVGALTPRERQVLLLNARGLSTDEIAGELSVGIATIRTHIYRLRTKLQLKDRAQLVSFAYRSGLVQPARSDR